MEIFLQFKHLHLYRLIYYDKDTVPTNISGRHIFVLGIAINEIKSQVISIISIPKRILRPELRIIAWACNFLWCAKLESTTINQLSRSEEFHFGGSYAKNSSSILRSTEDESSMIWRCAVPAMNKTPQNMPERSNSLLSPTYWLVARGNNW